MELAYFKMKDNLLGAFHQLAIEDKVATEEKGRPIFRDVDCITIMIPGNKNQIVDRIVREDDKRQYAHHWNAYQAGKIVETEGTPVALLPGVSPAVAMELKAINIITVEQLATVSDGNVDRITGGYSMVNRAKAYLAALEAGKLEHESEETQTPEPEQAPVPTAIIPKQEKKRKYVRKQQVV